MKRLRQVTRQILIKLKRELSVNRKVIQAPTLAGPPWLYQGSGPPGCTTPRQPIIYFGFFLGAAIPPNEFEVCSKVPIRDRRSIFEQFSSVVGKVSKSWSIQNIHQTSSKSCSVQNIHQTSADSHSRKNQSFSQYLPNGAKPPMPLVGSNTPALRFVCVTGQI